MPMETPAPRLTEKFHEALTYAAEKHQRQTRKGGDIPYIGHLLSVAGLVIEAGGSETEAIAALLHDAAEDQGGKETLAEIREISVWTLNGSSRSAATLRRPETALARTKDELHRASEGCVRRHDPGLACRQGGQRPSDSARLPAVRVGVVAAFQCEGPKRSPLVLPITAGCVPAQD